MVRTALPLLRHLKGALIGLLPLLVLGCTGEPTSSSSAKTDADGDGSPLPFDCDDDDNSVFPVAAPLPRSDCRLVRHHRLRGR